MSEIHASGSFPVSQVVGFNLTERFEKLEKSERKLFAILYALEALWYLTKDEATQSVKFPAIINGMAQSPVRYLINRATAGQDTPEGTATKARDLFEEFVHLNQEAIGFGGELKFAKRETSKGRIPLALILEVERIARPDRVIAENSRELARVMGVILNSGKGSIDEEVQRPGAELSLLLSKLCPLAPGGGVLDMSCGTGTLLSMLLGDKSRIRAYGQEIDQELAIISWLRMKLHPAAESAQVQVGDPLRYGYAGSCKDNPVDVALVHSIDLDADEEGRAAAAQFLREAEENEQEVTRKLAKLEHLYAEALRARNEASHKYDDAQRAAETSAPAAVEIVKEMEARARMEEARFRDVERELFSVREMAMETSWARKAAYERAKKPVRERTHELISHGLSCVGKDGLTIAVVSARELFKSPQVDRLRGELIEHDRLDLVVELPRGVDGAEERLAVLVFRKGRKDEPVLFVDATDPETLNRVAKPAALGAPVIGYRRSRSTVLTPEFFGAIAQICLDRVDVPGVAALVARSIFAENSSGGRRVDLRPRQFLVTDRLEEAAGASQARLAECYQAVVSAEAALIKARAQLGLPPLFTPTSSSKPSRHPGN
jgi:hypothetical protein